LNTLWKCLRRGGPVLAFAGALIALAGPLAHAAPDHVRGRVLVQFQPNTSVQQIRSLVAAANASDKGEIPHTGVHILELPPQANEFAVQRAFAQRAEVVFADLDRYFAPQDVTPNDPLYALWGYYVKKISCPIAWSTTTGSSDVIIAILDTGCDPTHPDLAPKYVPGWNFYNNNSDTRDVYGHGTPVAGTAAAIGNNGVGVAGVAWGSKIMPLRISDTQGVSNASIIAPALTWAADHGARVANISYAVVDDPTVDAAAKYFQSKGGVVTSSAGNAGAYHNLPYDPYQLSVSATDSNDILYSWSNTGTFVSVAAPGASYTTINGGGYGTFGGTSCSAPVVAGVAALVISVNPTLSGVEAKSIVEMSADDLGTAGYDTSYGYGRVNAARAVAMSAGSTGPAVTVTSPSAGSTVAGTATVQVSATDSNGIASVTLFVDGASIGKATAAPYSFPWDSTTYSNSAHTIKAVAVNGIGNAGNAQVNVTVNNNTADTTPPTVNITSPVAGGTVSGTVSVQVNASDNVGVASVKFYVDGMLVSTVASSPYSYSWNSATSPNGSHTLKAIAADASGNTAASQITVTVNNTVVDTIAPTISIISPAAGATVSGNVSVKVNANDNVGVAKVEFYVDGTLKGSSTAAPFTINWNTRKLKAGSHTIYSMAYDPSGNAGTSPTVLVYK
jgi:thermitase